MSDKSKFQVGDTVVLKSGGPKMTVVKIEDPDSSLTDNVRCVWFTENGSITRASFPEAALDIADVEEDVDLSDLFEDKTDKPSFKPIKWPDNVYLYGVR